MLELISLTNEDHCQYSDAVGIQKNYAIQSRVGFLFFIPNSILTIGYRGTEKDIHFTESEILENQIQVLKVDRGGQVTYHGPGQVLIFPFGKLSEHTADSRGVRIFIEKIQNNIIEYIQNRITDEYQVLTSLSTNSTTGIWLKNKGDIKKVASFGMRFEKDGITHGIALNLFPHRTGVVTGFSKITACGDAQSIPGYVFNKELTNNEIEFEIDTLKNYFRKG